MKSYIAALSALPRDLKLFFLFNILANIGFGVFQLVFNLYLVKLEFREDYIGLFNGIQTVFMALAGLTLGATIARLGIWPSLIGGMLLFFTASYLVALVEQSIVLLMISAMYGFGLCFLFNFSMPFILEFAPANERARAAAITFSGQSLAITLGSLLGGFMPGIVHRLTGGEGDPGVTDYRITLIAGTVIATIGMVPLFLMGDARRSRAAQELARAAVTESPVERRQTKRDLSVFVLVAGVMALGVGTVIPFYNVFLTEEIGVSSRQVGYVFAFGSAAAAIIGLSSPWLSKRAGPLDAILGLRMVMLPAYLLLIIAPGYALAIFAHAIRQVAINVNWPIDSTFMGEILPPRARATAFGWRSGAWNLGSAISALAGGAIIVRWGYSPTFVIMVVFTALSAVIFTVYFRRHPRVVTGELGHRAVVRSSEEPSA
ncbi:MAG: MFS transporter [Thermomicrobiales bacterium]|nr:MFS transporter [Thermomicrobiales bacterium]